MKKVFSLILALTLCLSLCLGLCGCGDDVKDGTDDNASNPGTTLKASQGLAMEKHETEPYYIVTGLGTCTDSTVVIPDTYEGLPVKEISRGAFARCTSVSEIIMPDSVTVVGEFAFENNDQLVSVRLSNNLTVLGAGMFDDSAITSITVPSSVISAKDAFGNCTSLRSIVFLGDAPAFSKRSFDDVVATVYYDKDNPTWTSEVKQDYKGELTWIGVDAATLNDYA